MPLMVLLSTLGDFFFTRLVFLFNIVRHDYGPLWTMRCHGGIILGEANEH